MSLAFILSSYYLVIFILNFFISILILKKQPKSTLHWLISFVSLSSSFWALGWFGIIQFQTETWIHITFSGGLAGVCFLVYSFLFPETNDYKKLLKYSIILLPSLAGIILAFSGKMIVSIDSFFPLSYTGTIPNSLIRIYWLIIAILSPIVFFIRLKKIPSSKRAGSGFFFAGSITFISCGVIGNILLPVFFDNQYFTGLAPAASFIWLSMLWISLTKSNFLEFKVVVSDFFAKIILCILVIISSLPYFLLINIIDNAVIIPALAIFWAIFGKNVYDFLLSAAKHAFIKGHYNKEKLLLDISEKIQNLTEIELILIAAEKCIDEHMQFETSGFFLANRVSESLIYNYHGLVNLPEKISDEFTIKFDSSLIERLSETSDLLKYEDLKEENQAILRNAGFRKKAMLIPIRSLGNLEGCIILGERSGDIKITDEDYQLLITIQKFINGIVLGLTPIEKVKSIFFDTKQRLHDAEIQVLRSQKMEDLAHVHRQFCHEVGTPLNCVKQAARKLPETEDVAPMKKLINTYVDEATLIIRETLKLTANPEHKAQREETAVDLNLAIEESTKFVIPDTYQLVLDLDPNLPKTLGVYRDLQMVFSNLISNATKAMPDGGSITIRTRQKGDDLLITFTDTGCGIPEERLVDIWQPYVSGASASDGGNVTGQKGWGLSIVNRIVGEHYGHIRVESVVDEGTTFTIRLPVR